MPPRVEPGRHTMAARVEFLIRRDWETLPM